RQTRSLPSHGDGAVVAATGTARGAVEAGCCAAGTTRAAVGTARAVGGTGAAAMATLGAGRSMYAVVTPGRSDAAAAAPIPAVTILPSERMVVVPPLVDRDGRAPARIPGGRWRPATARARRRKAAENPVKLAGRRLRARRRVRLRVGVVVLGSAVPAHPLRDALERHVEHRHERDGQQGR